MKKALNIIKTVLSVLAAVLPLLIIILSLNARLHGELPSLFGYSISIVVSPSMKELPTGTLILSKAYKPSYGLEKGDIITYLGETGTYSGKFITHAVENIETNSEGVKIITAKGSNNQSPDPEITEEAVKALFVRKLIGLGKIYTFFSRKTGVVAIILILISGYAIIRSAVVLIKIRKDSESELKEREENEEAKE